MNISPCFQPPPDWAPPPLEHEAVQQVALWSQGEAIMNNLASPFQKQTFCSQIFDKYLFSGEAWSDIQDTGAWGVHGLAALPRYVPS